MIFPPDITAQLTSSVQSEFAQLWQIIAVMVGVSLFFWSSRQIRGMFLNGKRDARVT